MWVAGTGVVTVTSRFTVRGSITTDGSSLATRATTPDAGACGRRHGVGAAFGYAGLPTTAISDAQTRVRYLTAASGCRFFCVILPISSKTTERHQITPDNGGGQSTDICPAENAVMLETGR
jgi:hypothetical protein